MWSEVDLRPLLAATSSAQAASAFDRTSINRVGQQVPQAHPIWPVYTFLSAEVYRLRKETGDAQSAYRNLAEWAAGDPIRDGWGGSSLAGVALWRWLEMLGATQAGTREEVERALAVFARLRETRLFRRLFADPLFSKVPRLEEDLFRRLAVLAWSGAKTSEALRLFLDYLSIATTAELSPVEAQLSDRLLSLGLASPDHLTLFRGKRLLPALRMRDQAYALLTEARRSHDPQVRAEAALYLARLERIRGAARGQIATLLSSAIEEAADPEVVQEALLDRFRVLNREGPGRDVEQAYKDLLRLANDFPRGPRTDEALNELARYHQNAGELDRALPCYARLRSLPEPNDYVNSAAYVPALGLHFRNGPGDTLAAKKLLEELNQQRPFGPLRANTFFWLGKMASDLGLEQEAQGWYRQLVNDNPYSYYAIRARMHLRLGRAASKQLWPDAGTLEDLRAAYRRSQPYPSLTVSTPYQVRLNGALKTGLYADALAADRRLRESFPSRRLEDLTLQELDDSGWFSHLALWLALRQDALAANDASPSPANRLAIAAAVARGAADWPLAISLTMAGGEPQPVRAAVQRDPAYLATAYPPVFAQAILRSAAARGVKPELLYSVVRHESLFYPAALSEQGALGLFQFVPATFQELNRRWKLLSQTGIATPEAYLLNPERSIDLGARLFQEESLRRHHGNILMALLEHNAGTTAVRDWVAQWKSAGRNEDVEYMLETVRFQETRTFVREVLTSMVIVEAAGIFREAEGASRASGR